jgi:predicted nuclease with TOPRIM domain
MTQLDNNSPQKQMVELETIKLDEQTLKSITDLSNKSNRYINEFGQLYLRKKELQEELENIESAFTAGENEFKDINAKIKEIADELDDKYPQSRIDLQNGTLTYQPGALSRKQQIEQQKQQFLEGIGETPTTPVAEQGMKVVKE